MRIFERLIKKSMPMPVEKLDNYYYLSNAMEHFKGTIKETGENVSGVCEVVQIRERFESKIKRNIRIYHLDKKLSNADKNEFTLANVINGRNYKMLVYPSDDGYTLMQY